MTVANQSGLKPHSNLSTDFERNTTVNDQFEARDVFRLVRSKIEAGVGNVPDIAHMALSNLDDGIAPCRQI